MSSLMVASDLDLMMLEISIEQLAVPPPTEFDSALLKKTVVMFRLLDKDWTSVYPQRKDYHVYRGSNSEVEHFHGGVSMVFPLPQSSLETEVDNLDLQIHVRRELSKYFERQSSESVGIACIDVSDLFNGVINDIKKGSDNYTTRAVAARSSKDTYTFVKEDGSESGAQATVYLRITHLGHSVISEIEVPDDPKRLFYAKKATQENVPYQCRELTLDELTSGCWGSETLLPPRDPRETMRCCCNSKDTRTPKLTKGLTEGEGANDYAESDIREGAEGDDTSKIDYQDLEGGGGKKRAEKFKEGDDDDNGDDDNKTNQNNDEIGTENGTGKVKETEGEGASVSCLVKPILCGREGTCNKKDKKGKYGKCGKPDGEGGNPQACGERRKCARRKMAAGSATVGIVDKKIPCPPPRVPRVCPCATVTNYSPPWSPCSGTSSLCATCQPVYYGSSYAARSQNLTCHNYETPRYGNESTCQPMPVGWR